VQENATTLSGKYVDDSKDVRIAFLVQLPEFAFHMAHERFPRKDIPLAQLFDGPLKADERSFIEAVQEFA
jgi:hypothetical protein